MNRLIIDCHRHLSITEQNKTYEDAAKALLLDMEKNGVSKSVIIADNVEESGTADIETLLKIFDGHEEILLIGAINPFDQPEDKLAKIEKLVLEKKIIGLKLYNGHDKIYPTDRKCFSTYELCNKHDIPLMIHTGGNSGDSEVAKFNDPKMIVEIASKFPKLKIVISHYFWPRLEYCYEATKDIPNIFFDTSALADQEVIDESGGIQKVKNILEKTIHKRNDSVLFGTDYGMCKTKDHIDLINSLEITDDLKNRIFSKNFLDLY
ncbi:MAG: amidohydrolase family protein [bacterium]